MLFSTFPDKLLQLQIEYMKISVKTPLLQKSLNLLSHAVSTRSQLPILSNILIEARDGTLSLTSTDLEIGITINLTAEVKGKGETTVPAKTFSELVSSLRAETTEIELEDASLIVRTKNTNTSFSTQPSQEFPKLYLEKGEKIAVVDVGSFVKDVEPVIFSASIDMSRPALTGVLIRPEEDGILLVATDGYRLSLRKSKTKIEKEAINLIVPSRVLREALSLKEMGKEFSIFIAKEHNQIIFEIGDTILVGRLIDGEFPPFEKIIPTDHSTTVSFSREDLLDGVKMCSIFARESANIIKFSLKKDSIVVSSQTPSLGENTVTVEARLKGEENEIAFNARYLLDVLSHIDAKELEFEMTGPLNPGVFKIQGENEFLHLIMPIRIQA